MKSNMSFASLDMNTNNTLLSEPSTPTRLNANDNSTATDSSPDTTIESQSSAMVLNDTNHVTQQTKSITNEETIQPAAQLSNGSLKTAQSSQPQSQLNAVHAYLSMPCRTLSQLKTVVPYLVDHAIISVEERVSKRLTTKYKVRSQIPLNSGLTFKDKFLEQCSPENFSEFEALVRRFVERCRTLLRPESSLALNDNREQLTAKRSPLIAAVQVQTAKFIKCFHETCTTKLRLVSI